MPYLGGIQDRLDRRNQTILVLLQLWLILHCPLDQQLDVTQLAEVEIPLLLQASDALLQLRILLLQVGGSATTTKRCSGSSSTTDGRGSSSLRSVRTDVAADGLLGGSSDHGRRSLSAGKSIVVATGIVLIPESLRPLQELQVVLHLALDESLDVDGPVDVLLGEVY